MNEGDERRTRRRLKQGAMLVIRLKTVEVLHSNLNVAAYLSRTSLVQVSYRWYQQPCPRASDRCYLLVSITEKLLALQLY
jgi:hypothetical protein